MNERIFRCLPRQLRGIAMTLFATTAILSGCGSESPSSPDPPPTMPEHNARFGIYRLDTATGGVDLLYSSDNSLHRIDLSPSGARLVFEEDFGDDVFHDSEICVMDVDGSGFLRLTGNGHLDAYPSWSPDGTKILFLCWPDYPDNTMDIWVMNADGTGAEELYDSGFHDGDCDWVGSRIVFTCESRIWVMDDDGTDPVQLTDFYLAGQQGGAGLPFGDYDPRLDPSGTVVCFDRMVDDQNPSGNWDFYTVNADGTGEAAVTGTGWQQFMAEWSTAGDRLLFTVAAMGGDGLYDLYGMDPDGSDLTVVTPAEWPPLFLCSHGIYSHDDSSIFFVGEWWE